MERVDRKIRGTPIERVDSTRGELIDSSHLSEFGKIRFVEAAIAGEKLVCSEHRMSPNNEIRYDSLS